MPEQRERRADLKRGDVAVEGCLEQPGGLGMGLGRTRFRAAEQEGGCADVEAHGANSPRIARVCWPRAGTAAGVDGSPAKIAGGAGSRASPPGVATARRRKCG